ncbi:MAG TPA: amino acid permease [Planctomycetota bacterium]|nr:amino acid permease [Planctomycetota bacterium]
MAGEEKPELKRVIGFWGGTALIIGITIGAGIFRKPYTLAKDLHDPVTILGLWTLFGLISLAGALALAELSSMLPRTGGAYVFLRAAYGDSAAFVFGWIYLLVTAPAGIGALAAYFAELLLGLLGRDLKTVSPWTVPGIAASTVVLLSFANLLGARLGAAIQGLFTLIKCAALVLLIGVSLFLSSGSAGHWSDRAGATVSFATLGSGVAAVIWAYDGWIAVSMIAGEVVAPERLMKRVIVMGMLAIVVLYVGANLGYFFAMPVDAMAAEVGGVPQKIMKGVMGDRGATLIAGGIMCSVFGALNGNILAKPRVSYALSQDGLTFKFLGRTHPRWSTPYAAILIQAAVAVLLIFLLRDPEKPQRLFDDLTTYFVVVEWFALLFSVGAVLVLRRRMPDTPRPYRTPGYPWVPLFFLGGTAVGLSAIVWSELKAGHWSPVMGLGIAAAGFPVFWIWRRKRPSPPASPPPAP